MLILKLLTAHFLGDFVFQFTYWVKDKEKQKIKSKYLYLHTLVHALLMVIFTGFQKQYVGVVAVLTVFHFLIDVFKLYSSKEQKRMMFFVDQLLHLISIVAVAIVWNEWSFDWQNMLTNKNCLLLLCLVCVTAVASVVLKVIFSFWNKDVKQINKEGGLQNAGKYIGMLERLFVFTFVVVGQWKAIGFILAAKSIFRFGDLTKAKDRQLTEYILIGTFLSFGIAMLIGLLYNYWETKI
ncbi:DUF3307 domain-containing protein [Ochrovirga pacifica]|uniref:DUF3307 domain-containing protein n=1 Tax=Ochrovirga pacifica TaxID=1042376 RepID=UPI00025597CF|nr:DUF3307 domain-containing protein [Ochrovirga pacifica]